MIELPRRARRCLLVAHVVTSVGWLGAGAANTALAVSAARGGGPLDAHAAYLAVSLLDTWVVIPAAFSTLVIGTVLSVCTSWGLTRHWWVVVKFLLTCAVIVFSTFGVGVWVDALITVTGSGDMDGQASALVWGACANLGAFLVMTWLSIAKPRGVTPWAKRPR